MRIFNHAKKHPFSVIMVNWPLYKEMNEALESLK